MKYVADKADDILNSIQFGSDIQKLISGQGLQTHRPHDDRYRPPKKTPWP
jgi:hypothetical protein